MNSIKAAVRSERVELMAQMAIQETHSMALAEQLIEKFRTRDARIAVVGLGYVGLPLAITFAEAGLSVIGIDLDHKKVAKLNTGRSYIGDVKSKHLKALLNIDSSGMKAEQSALWSTDSNHFTATINYDAINDVDAVIVCVPTPLSKTKEPDMSYVIAAVDEIARRLHRGMLIVLESTTYPGTTEELVLPRLEEAHVRQRTGSKDRMGAISGQELTVATEMNKSEIRGLTVVGKDFFLAFSPERIDPGRSDWTVRNTPKVIGGITPSCLRVAQALYECAVEQVVPVSSPRVAEMVKLLENTFRAVNIAFINELAIMCDWLGIDVWEVIEAAKTKPFGFTPFYPGPGVGGHCIPVDPQYLSWKLRTLNYNARFVELAMEINSYMPQYVLGKIVDGLNKLGKTLKGAQILMLGVAYKPNVGDIRESPALELIQLLQEKDAQVTFHDPYVRELGTEEGLALASVALNAATLQAADCVVIMTAHNGYDWDWIIGNSRMVMDTRNATKEVATALDKIVKL